MTAFTNAAPAAPTGVSLIGGTKQITVKWTACPDYDYDYTRVEYSTTSGGTYTLFGTIKGTSLDITGLGQATTYWVRVAHVDSFGPTALNYSTPVSTATDNFNSLVDARIGAAVINGSQLVGQSIPQSALSTEALYAPLAVIGDVRNLVRNPLGDRGTDGWEGVVSATATGFDWGAYSGNAYKGQSCLVFDDRDATYGDFVPVGPGDQFWVSCMNIPRGGTTGNYTLSIGIAVYDKNKNAFNWHPGATRATTVNGAQLLQGSCTITSSDAVYIKPWIQISKTPGTTNTGTPGDGYHLSGITVTRKNKGELIVDGSIYGQHLGVNTVTANNIDTRGLDIKDAAGTVIFASGTPLADTYINAGKPGNLLQNTENRSGETYSGKGWGVASAGTGVAAEITYTTGLTTWPAGEWFPSGSNPFAVSQNGVSGTDTTSYSDIRSDAIPVISGQRYEASVYVQTHRCKASLYIVYANAAGTGVGTFNNHLTMSWELIANDTAKNIGSWYRLNVFGTAPATATTARVYLRKWVTNDSETATLSSYAWWLYPYFGFAGINQTQFSPYSPGAEWVPNGTIRVGNQITAANASTYIASAAIGDAQVGTLSASKIDTRGLTIKDASGNIIFGSGNNLDWSRVVASNGWLNSQINISGGTLVGIGSGAGTMVANYAIGIDGSGLITGIGTGTNTPVSNNVIAQYGNILVNTENKSNENPLGKGWTAVSTIPALSAVTFATTELLRNPSSPYDWQPLGANATVIQHVGVVGAVTDYTNWMSDNFPVIPNANYEFSVYIQTHRCKSEIYLVYFDNANAYVSATYGGVANNSSPTAARNLSTWTRLGNIGTIPSNAVSARLFIRKFRTDTGQSDSYSWHLYPYVGRAGSSQTTLSAYSPGAEWVPGGTVRPDNRISAANISTFMDSAAIGSAYIGDAQVGTLKIAGESATFIRSFANNTPTNSINGTLTVMDNTFTMPYASSVVFNWSAKQTFMYGVIGDTFTINVNGTDVYAWNVIYGQELLSVTQPFSLSAGSNNIKIKWTSTSTSGIVLTGQTMTILASLR